MKKNRNCKLFIVIILVNFFVVIALTKLEKFTAIPKEESELDAVKLEMLFFPIPTSSLHNEYKVSFYNDYGAGRDYAGKRSHEGCDIIAKVQKAGLYPVISMTDGVISKFGYIPLGGYRIGIKTSSNHYYYYAHLAAYKKEFRLDEKVHAGEILGYMGDTGYGEEEGTSGNMPVHLHVGIYKLEPNHSLTPINPYPYLKRLEKKKITLSY